jgi:hypothetical protein
MDTHGEQQRRSWWSLNCPHEESCFVWKRIREVAPALRESLKNSNLASNLETVANTMAADRLRDAAFGV